MHRSRRALALALLLLCLQPAAALAIGIGDEAPRFELPQLGGDQTIALAEYRGKVVYLDFWASWCAPCLSALPALETLRRELPAQDFQIVAINIDQDPRKALQLLARKPVGYPSGSDPQGEWPGRFGIPTMPTSYLIDREGVVRYVHPGFRDGDLEEIRKQVLGLIEAR